MSTNLVRIEDFCKTGSGSTPSRKQVDRYYKDGSIPWVKSGELREGIICETEESITEIALKETAVKSVPKGALLVAMYGATIGRIATLGVDATTNQAVCHLIPDSSIVDSRYFFYALYQKVSYWLSLGVGGAQPNISQQIIKKTEIPLPPIAEQKRIAAILDKADAVRRKRREAIRLTEELLRSVFLDMFGDPVTNPMGWPSLPLDELIAVTSGQVNPIEEPYCDMLHVGGENIASNTGVIANCKTPKELGLISGKYLFEPGDILYSKIRPYLNKVAVIDFKGICSADIYPIRVNSKKIQTLYLLFTLRSKSFLDYVEKHSTRTNIPKVNRKALLRFSCLLPPIELQEEFAKFVAKIASMRKRLCTYGEESEDLFNSLLQRAFTGNL
jgi:type I restriction enzyme S subunit